MWEDIKWLLSQLWQWVRPEKQDVQALIKAQQEAMEKQAKRYEDEIANLIDRQQAFIAHMEIRHAAIVTLQNSRITELEAKEQQCAENLRTAYRKMDRQDAKIASQEMKITTLEVQLAEVERVEVMKEDQGFRDRSMQQTKLLIDEDGEGGRH